jgi:hypothetical protein
MKYNRLLRFLTVPLSVLFMVFALGAGNALAQSTIHVNDDTGDDVTGDGSEGSPYETIGTAQTNAAAGDVISIAAGTYNEDGSQLAISKNLTFTVTDYAGSSTLVVPNGLGVNSGITLSMDGNPTVDAAIDNQGTLDLSDAGAVFHGDLTNNGGTTQLGGSTLSLAEALTIDNQSGGEIISTASGEVGSGTVRVAAGSGNSVVFATNGGEVPSLVVANGILDLNGQTVSVYGGFTQSGGTVQFTGGGTLDVNGDFNRTGGTFTAGTGTLEFSGSADQTINPGAALEVNNLSVSNAAGASLTLGSSFTANGDVTIAADGALDLGSRTLRLEGSGQTISNSGVYMGSGNVVAVNGATLSGGGTFGNLDVRDNSSLGSAVDLSGTLILRSGDFDLVGNTLTLTDENTMPVINRYGAAAVIDSGTGGSVTTATDVTYSLIYSGGTAGGSFTTGQELVAASLNNLTVDTAGEEGNVTTVDASALTADVELAGALNVNQYQVLNLGTNAFVFSNANTTHSIEGSISAAVEIAADGVTIETGEDALTVNGLTLTSGSLDVGASDKLIVAGDLTRTNGSFVGADTLEVDADGGVTITPGSGFTVENFALTDSDNATAEAATVSGNGFTVSNSFTHEVATLALQTNQLRVSGETYNYMSGAYTSGGTDGRVNITGPTTVTLAGDVTIPRVRVNSSGTVTLATDDMDTPTPRTLTAGTSFSHAAGTIALGINDLNATGYTRTGGSYTASSTDSHVGELILNGSFSSGSGLSVPNVTVASAVSQSDDHVFTVENQLDLGAGLTTASAGNLTIGDGATIIVNADDALANAPTFSGAVNLVYNVTATATSENEIPDDGMIHDLTVNAALTTGSGTDVTVSNLLTLDAGWTNNGDAELANGAALVLQAGNDVTTGNGNPTLTTAGWYDLTYQTAGAVGIDANSYGLDDGAVNTLTVDVGTGNAATIATSGNHLNADDELDAGNVDLASGDLAMDGVPVNVSGNFSVGEDGSLSSASAAALTFVDGENQWINLDGDLAVPTNVNITLDKADGWVMVSGGDLDFDTNDQVLALNGGVLATEGNAAVVLQDISAGTSAYSRDVADTVDSHIAGNVERAVTTSDTGLLHFPTGSENGDYRPYRLRFNAVPSSNTSIRVRHVDSSPGGTDGLPIASGDTTVSSWSPFYWSVSSDVDLAAEDIDVRLTAEGYGNSSDYDDVESLRIIRRFEGAQSNPWTLQGSAENYTNFEGTDQTSVVEVMNSSGGLTEQGVRFAIGIPTSGPLAPSFTQGPSSISLDIVEGTEIDTTIAYRAEPADEDFTIEEYGLDGAPDYVSIDSTNGDVTIAIPASDPDTLSASFSVTATDDNGRTAMQMVSLEVRIATSVDEPVAGLPEKFALEGNYPNPFNPTTNIQFDLPAQADVRVEVYNTLGQRVMMLPVQQMQAGADQTIQVEASSLSSGMYLYRVIAETAERQMVESGKMMLMK